MARMQTSQTALIRALGRQDAFSLVVGTIVGTGIFLKTATMAQSVGSAGAVFLAWAVAGILSLVGALTYAELGALYPEAGGEYVYVREGWGRFLAFLYGWQRFWIGSPGSIAAYAVGAATFMNGILPIERFGGLTGVSIAFILFFTVLNCFSVAFGGRVQSWMTALKFVLILGITLGIFLFSSTGSFTHFSASDGASASFPLSAFGAAVLAALWAFDGWNNLPMAAGEVKQPDRTLPFALSWGTLAVILVYVLANASYFYALPFHEILNANSSDFPNAQPVATKAALTFLGASGGVLLSFAFVCSALGAMNGSILTNARIPYAMAKDGLFLQVLSQVTAKTRVPAISVIVQGILACVFAASGTFDQLTDLVVFASWVFYALCAGSVLRLRHLRPQVNRPYRVPFYPWLPIVFCILAVALLFNTFWVAPKQSFIGLTLILIGAPVYWFLAKQGGEGSKPAIVSG